MHILEYDESTLILFKRIYGITIKEAIQAAEARTQKPHETRGRKPYNLSKMQKAGTTPSCLRKLRILQRP